MVFKKIIFRIGMWNSRPHPPSCKGGRYVLKIHFFIESGQKMIQFKIQFKTKSKIFIQKNIHSTESIVFNGIIHSKKIEENIHSTESIVFNGIIHKKKLKKIIQNSNLINWFLGFHYLTSNYLNGIKYHGLNLF